MTGLLESLEDRNRRIEREQEPRLILWCTDCKAMTRYARDLTWHCSECGGGDLSTGQVEDELERGLR